MDPATFFLSSGLFMGWSLGANDAANIFGTAVGTKMIRFGTAILICSIFIIIGAVVSGSGTSQTLGELGSINALPGAFIVALSAALTVLWMTKVGLPISTSQAIVGAIVGWNLFSGNATDMNVLYKIAGAWFFTPVLGAIFAIVLYFIVKYIMNNVKIHMLELDRLTKLGFIVAGAFGSYSLGMNNIANVVGVFTVIAPFTDLKIGDFFVLSGVQQLFLLGGISIALGVLTYAKKVMMTVGSNIYKLSPITAFIVVLASSLVLFIFASETLRIWMLARGLPAIPLVPVSQSQGVVGAISGIGIAKGGGNVNVKLMSKIFVGWILTPVCAGVCSFIFLFFMQNVFMFDVYI